MGTAALMASGTPGSLPAAIQVSAPVRIVSGTGTCMASGIPWVLPEVASFEVVSFESASFGACPSLDIVSFDATVVHGIVLRLFPSVFVWCVTSCGLRLARWSRSPEGLGSGGTGGMVDEPYYVP